jgi:hypothetical protein
MHGGPPTEGQQRVVAPPGVGLHLVRVRVRVRVRVQVRVRSTWLTAGGTVRSGAASSSPSFAADMLDTPMPCAPGQG